MNGNGSSSVSDPYTGIIGAVVKWFQHPFNKEGDAFSWFLFLGLLIVMAGLWNIILLHLTEEL